MSTELDRIPLPERADTPSDGLAVLRRAIADTADQLPALAGDTEALAHGTHGLDQLIGDLRMLRADAERMLIDAIGDERQVELDGLGRVEWYTSKDRERWESEALLQRIVALALDPEGNGELTAAEVGAAGRIVAMLLECVPFTASLGWRKRPLKAIGLLAGGKGDETDETDDDGRTVRRDARGFLTFIEGDRKVRFSSVEGKR